MKNLLLVSIAFPPKNDPECLQTAKYFKYLAQCNNLHISILTSKNPTLFMPVDPVLAKYVKGFKEIIEIPIYENKYVSYLIRKVGLNIMDKPDSKFTFHLQWKKASKKLSDKPDVIYSRSFPLSSALMAFKLKKALSRPWIMHLSDPWADSPLHDYIPKLLRWHNKMERLCIESADIISLTSEKALTFYKEKYPALKDKFMLFPNVYDEEDLVAKEWKFGDKLKIVYTGGLINDRSPQALFAAIDLLLKRNPECLEKVEFIFSGQMDRKNKQIFENKNYSFVKHIGHISYTDSLALQQTACMLLIIDNPLDNPKRAMFFPSKLLDYMLAQKRILAITSRNSSTYDVIQNSLSDCLTHNDTKGIANAIMNAVCAFENRNYNYFKTEYLDKSYSAAYNAQKLERLIYGL